MTADLRSIDINITPYCDEKIDAKQKLRQYFIRRGFGSFNPIERILLINPPDVDKQLFSFDTFLRGRYTNYPPYGLGVLASNIREIGATPSILNLNNEILKHAKYADRGTFDFDTAWRAPLTRELTGFRPSMVLVTCMFSQTHDIFSKVCKFISDEIPDCLIMVGGVHVTNSMAVEETREKLIRDLCGISLVAKGEGDLTVRSLVRFINDDGIQTKVGQIYFIDRTSPDTTHFVTYEISDEDRPESHIMDIIPAHDLIDPREHSRFGKLGAYFYLKDSRSVFANVLANRGCRAQCTFCSVRNFNGVGVMRRSISSVVDELKLLRDMGVDHFMWLDDDLLYKEDHAIALFNAITKADLKMSWDCTNGVIAASCTTEVVHAAAESGCIGLSIGMESGNPEILRSIKKPGTVKKFIEAAENIKRFDRIYSRVFLIIGFPGETYSQILDTLAVSKAMGLDWYQIQVLQPLPNTPIYKKMVSEGFVDPQDFANVSYTGGVYGKNSQRNGAELDVLAMPSVDSLRVSDSSKVVPAVELQAIWAKMVIELNYARNYSALSHIKARQILQNMEYVSEYVALGDMFALGSRIRLGRFLGLDTTTSRSRLFEALEDQPMWRARFADYNFSPD